MDKFSSLRTQEAGGSKRGIEVRTSMDGAAAAAAAAICDAEEVAIGGRESPSCRETAIGERKWYRRVEGRNEQGGRQGLRRSLSPLFLFQQQIWSTTCFDGFGRWIQSIGNCLAADELSLRQRERQLLNGPEHT